MLRQERIHSVSYVRDSEFCLGPPTLPRPIAYISNIFPSHISDTECTDSSYLWNEGARMQSFPPAFALAFPRVDVGRGGSAPLCRGAGVRHATEERE